MEHTINWMDWYFSHPKKTDPEITKLVFDVVKPGCSKKALTQIAKGVLDIDNPYLVNWKFFRMGHAYLKMSNLDRRTFGSAVSHSLRLSSKGFFRAPAPWVRIAAGWPKQDKKRNKELIFIPEDKFLEIEAAATQEAPTEMALGIRVALRLSYYCGMPINAVSTIRLEDLVEANGQTLLYKSGSLYDLPDHVRVPLAEWIRVRYEHTRKVTPRTRVFTPPVYRAVAPIKTLHQTFYSIRKLS